MLELTLELLIDDALELTLLEDVVDELEPDDTCAIAGSVPAARAVRATETKKFRRGIVKEGKCA